ncbi:MAG: hypothetical protein LBS93_02685, partial [Synergistaceae bacterium]|nr:hypothetical protein [Synergistaceae bacterium]
GTSGRTIILGLRVAALAALLVMASGLPLSMDQDRPFQGFSSGVAVLTSTESDILHALRESLSNRNNGRVLLSIELPEPGAAAPGSASAFDAPPAEPAMPEPQVVRTVVIERVITQEVESKKAETFAPQAAPAAGPSVEDVISLIQVGQRALRMSEPAIRIIPTQ